MVIGKCAHCEFPRVMPEGDRSRKATARQCPSCGQAFDPTIKFCPQDGARLSEELRLSGDIMSMSNTSAPIEQPGADSGGDVSGGKSSAGQAKAGSADNGNTKTVSMDASKFVPPAAG